MMYERKLKYQKRIKNLLNDKLVDVFNSEIKKTIIKTEKNKK